MSSIIRWYDDKLVMLKQVNILNLCKELLMDMKKTDVALEYYSKKESNQFGKIDSTIYVDKEEYEKEECKNYYCFVDTSWDGIDKNIYSPEKLCEDIKEISKNNPNASIEVIFYSAVYSADIIAEEKKTFEGNFKQTPNINVYPVGIELKNIEVIRRDKIRRILKELFKEGDKNEKGKSRG